MSKFNIYIIKLFVKYTITVQLFVAIISLIANTFQHTKMLSEYSISFATLLMYDSMKIPYLLYTTMPMTIVISTMLVIVTLLKNNELTAYVALGGKIRSLAYPFLISGILLSGLLYFSADVINPKIMLKREKFAFENIKKKKFNLSGKLTDMWLKESDNKFVNISVMDPVSEKIVGIREYILNDDFQVDSIITYDSASRTDTGWIEKNRNTYTMSPVPKLTESSDVRTEERELFDELTSLPVLSPKYLSISEMKRTSEIMKKQDINTAKYDLQLYGTYAHVVSVLVIILVIFPLCIGFNRNHSHIAVASKSIFTGFGYWLLMASLKSLGKTGLLSPFTANFLPIGLFIILAVVLIYRRERAL